MKSLVFSQTGVYRLQLLSTLVKQKTGVRHHLSDPKSTINLLRYSSTSPDTAIYDAYTNFTHSLESDQRDYLQSRGLLMPSTLFSSNSAEIRRPIARLGR